MQTRRSFIRSSSSSSPRNSSIELAVRTISRNRVLTLLLLNLRAARVSASYANNCSLVPAGACAANVSPSSISETARRAPLFLAAIFFHWLWIYALALFLFGWALQFIGHAFERKADGVRVVGEGVRHGQRPGRGRPCHLGREQRGKADACRHIPPSGSPFSRSMADTQRATDARR